MNGSVINLGAPYVGVLALLALVGAGIVAWFRVGAPAAVVTAATRATVQLAAVSLIIVAVLRSWWLTVAFVVAMYAVATVTSARRVSTLRAGWPTALPIGLGVLPAVVLLLVTGVLPVTPLAVLPSAGILIGGAMTATTLAGRRALDELRNRHGEYEAGLAIGLTQRDAALEVCRPAASQALIPALDQTRTVGLVTLPGAFVGVLLGGASPVQAGAAQLLILVALLAVEAIAVAATVELVARRRLRAAR
ncbi:ABC transporter permease [Micromonospora sp. WMMD1082]|uniref:ABC transporter permease n=1 Tax=Micromonospora sp. WMMD1082 TaxID=3016104 RepID=UPI002416B7DC|nr:ABC transporter permease [Micromonospora sp. WMMD1082]MDG4797105.1 ABC transporter permease [Micromonospora sp. WMMD1082]